MTETTERACRSALERPPAQPIDIDRFSSNTLFGEPGIYPGGTEMIPAAGPRLTAAGAEELLADWFAGEPEDPAGARAERNFTNPDVVRRVPDPAVRAALCLLIGSPAAPVADAFVHGTATVTSIGVGRPDGDGRVVGPLASDRRGDDDTVTGPGPGHRVLNERYASEHPAVIAPSLAHALCHHGALASNAEEATLHGLLAAVHTWFLSARPELADLGTELARRQASLTITLLNARAPGSWKASICCPDGPGAIPGGNPALQSPDIWSIPFTSRPVEQCELAIPEPVRDSLARLAAPDAPAPPTTYDDGLGAWLGSHLGEGTWFGPCRRLAAGRALGLLPDA